MVPELALRRTVGKMNWTAERGMAKALALLGLLVLAGCGTSTTDRALSGGAIGAGSGFLLGGTTGALVGGGAGAAAGALTDSSDVNLGRPVWRR